MYLIGCYKKLWPDHWTCDTHISRCSTDMLVDIAADTLTVDYRRNIGRVSVVYRSTVLNQKFRQSAL